MTAPLALTFKKPTVSLAKRIGRAAVVALIVAGTFSALDAEARRMGGGRSVGRQSQTVQNQSTPPAQQPMQQQSTQPSQAQRATPAQPTPTPAAAPNRSRWLGPIAGLAAGLGIAALLSHFGLGEAFAGAMANFIVIALIAMVAIWLIRKFMGRRRQNEPAYGAAGSASMNAGGFGSGYSQEPRYTPPAAAGAFGSPSAGFDAAPEANAAPSVPAGFDTEAFLRNAKVNFVRLQAAWDEGNIADIREFTTPEMFAEVKIDIDSRGAERNQTDVVQLDAQMLGVEDRGSEYLASVRFSGLIRETAGAAAEPFVEVWNLSKSSRAGEGWLLAGIQQVSSH
ncbi:Tim44 domain-containing protein [Trinickia violacea]|uniref:Tim44 domain-containing protein n=1 Tax=Trinickia violacea TaxID=2571746 RepID=A0A4P8IMU4_9BURK|nr:TIM44-like domain-containing protein [Trinickia violacea]QCP48183.1 Tim44 domain-containing protein [Trinickia violacea]